VIPLCTITVHNQPEKRLESTTTQCNNNDEWRRSGGPRSCTYTCCFVVFALHPEGLSWINHNQEGTHSFSILRFKWPNFQKWRGDLGRSQKTARNWVDCWVMQRFPYLWKFPDSVSLLPIHRNYLVVLCESSQSDCFELTWHQDPKNSEEFVYRAWKFGTVT